MYCLCNNTHILKAFVKSSMYIYFIQAPLKYWIIKYNWNFNLIILNIIKEEHIVIEPKLKEYGVSYFQFINDLSSHPFIFSKQTDL